MYNFCPQNTVFFWTSLNVGTSVEVVQSWDERDGLVKTSKLTASSLALAFCSSALSVLKGLNLNFLKVCQLMCCIVKYIPFHNQAFFPWKPRSIIFKRHFTRCYHFFVVNKNFRSQEKLNTYTRTGFCKWLLPVLCTTKMLTVSWIAGICWMNSKCGLTVKCKTNHKPCLNYWGLKPHKVLDKSSLFMHWGTRRRWKVANKFGIYFLRC